MSFAHSPRSTSHDSQSSTCSMWDFGRWWTLQKSLKLTHGNQVRCWLTSARTEICVRRAFEDDSTFASGDETMPCVEQAVTWQLFALWSLWSSNLQVKWICFFCAPFNVGLSTKTPMAGQPNLISCERTHLSPSTLTSSVKWWRAGDRFQGRALKENWPERWVDSNLSYRT
jgi:hypothetical protein